MNCGCCKEIGCYAYGQIIDFGIESISACGPYTFEVWTNGAYSEITETFAVGDPIILPFTFNENSDTNIKIKLPSCLSLGSGVNYVTSTNGDCCFTVHGVISQCV
jgi:hypothetical protein